MQKFMAHAGLGDPPGPEAGAPRSEPSPEQIARMRATTEQFLAHLIRPTTRYRPDIEALRAASTRIVVAARWRSPASPGTRSAARAGMLVRHGGHVDQQPRVWPAQLHLGGMEQAEQDIPENWPTGSERNRRTFSWASSADRLSTCSAPLGPAVATAANLPHWPAVGRPCCPHPLSQDAPPIIGITYRRMRAAG